MLQSVDKSFRVRHQPQDAAGLITNTGNVSLRPVRIFGVGDTAGSRLLRRVGVSQAELSPQFQLIENRRMSRHKTPLRVRHRQVQPLHPLEKHAAAGLRRQIDPAIFEFSGIVESQRNPRGRAVIVGQQGPRLQQDLKPIADAEDEFAGVSKGCQTVGQMVANLSRQDATRSDVITVTKSTGKAEYLCFIAKPWILDPPINMNAICLGTGPGEGMRCFDVTVCARGRVR